MKNTLIRRVLEPIFVICAAAFLLLGLIIVLVQVFALLTLNGPLSIAIYGGTLLKAWAIRAAVIAGFCGFVLGYLKPEKPIAEQIQ